MEPRITTTAAVDPTTGAAPNQIEASTENFVNRVGDNRESNEEFLNSGELVVEEHVIRWERFLPRRFLRVLLVENDDSTRHIVAALLRKCNYKVAAVADGLKAWAVLKKRHYNFDLVLTEVVMPSLSGIGLLSKIMSNEICKSIPVIMMSSHDSMGIVFNCMLKGAADFLVKPVRKNELRNLWQHVWRKYCSGSSGDGSENGRPKQTKPETVSDNEVASNQRSSDAGSRFKTEDSSDKGSRTQSSCRTSETEIGSGQKLEEPLEADARIFSEETDPESRRLDCDMVMVATSSIHETGKAKVWERTGTYDGSLHKEDDPASDRSKECENIDGKLIGQTDGTNRHPKEIIEFIGAATTTQCSHRVLEDNDQREDTIYLSAKSDTRKPICNSGSSTLWELSLRRPQLSKEKEVFQAKHVLNHSVASAFSRYKNARSHFSSSAGFCSKTNESGNLYCDISSSAENGRNIPFPPNQRSATSLGGESLMNGQLLSGCNGEDMNRSPSLPSTETACIGISSDKYISPRPLLGVVPYPIPVGSLHMSCQVSSGCSKDDADLSTSDPSRETACIGMSSNRDVSHHTQLGVVPFSIPVGAILFQNTCTGFGPVTRPISYPQSSQPNFGSSEGQKDMFVIPSNPSAHNSSHPFCNALYWSSHHSAGNHRSHQLQNGMETQVVDIETGYPRVVMHPPEEKVTLGGNCGFPTTIANGANVRYEEICMAANNGTTYGCGNEDGFPNCNEKGLDSDRSRREAALNKFRLKRKDRCFEKKVRYHNRKKLAEQRPRMKGQFVRQAVNDQQL